MCKGGEAHSAGIQSERVEAWGGGKSYNLDICGRLGVRDERPQDVLRYIPRSLVSAPAGDHRMSRWRRPAAGRGAGIDLLRSAINVWSNLGDDPRVKSGEQTMGGQN